MPRVSQRPADKGRLVDLMWNPTTRVGRSGVTVEAIIDAAIEITDADGIESLTMRAVADRVTVGVMTIYGHVPGKAELLELMVDRMTGRTYAEHPTPTSVGPWDQALRYLARRNWEHLLAHPWLADVPQARPILGPGICRKYELELEPLDDIGLSDVDMDLTLTAVLAQVTHAARWHTALDRVRGESKLTDLQWWQLYGPALAHAMRGERLSISTRVGQSVSSAGNPEATWEFMVEQLIRGLQVRLDGAAT